MCILMIVEQEKNTLQTKHKLLKMRLTSLRVFEKSALKTQLSTANGRKAQGD